MKFTEVRGRVVPYHSEQLAHLERRSNSQFLSDAEAQWDIDPVMRDHRLRGEYSSRLRRLSELGGEEFLAQLLPSPERRPALLAGVLHELGELLTEKEAAGATEISREELTQASQILRILDVPYSPIFMEGVLPRIQEHVFGGGNLTFDWFEREFPGQINSTFRNVFLAQRLKDTILDGAQSFPIHIQMARYTWNEHKATVLKGHGPDLSNGTGEKPYVKGVIRIQATGFEHYADYGAGEGHASYGIHPTGEGLGYIVGSPEGSFGIDPHDSRNLIYLLIQVQHSQDGLPDREAVRRLGLHAQMTHALFDYVSSVDGTTSVGLGYPGVITSAENIHRPTLGHDHLQHTLQFAALVRQMWQEPGAFQGKVVFRELGTAFSLFRGKRVLIDMQEPSTRTITMARNALRALGMNIIELSSDTSSDAKGEGFWSKRAYMRAEGVDAWLMRGGPVDSERAGKPSIAQRIQNDQASDSSTPLLLSLGGKSGHPTQTCGELMTFMDHFGVNDFSVETLVRKTQADPPTISWMGHTGNKRADMGLIRFIREHLPHWNIRVVVPKEEYRPEFMFGEDDHYEVRVEEDLVTPEKVAEALSGSDFVYISNPVDTTRGGTGVEKTKKLDYQLSMCAVEILEAQGERPYIMAPLPGDEEIDANIGHSERCLAHEQMVNKVAFGISVLAHQFAAQDARRALERAV